MSYYVCSISNILHRVKQKTRLNPIVRSTYLFQRCWKNHSSVQMDQKDRSWKVKNNLGSVQGEMNL